MRKVIGLIFSVLFCELAGVLGSIFTLVAIPTWYADLVKPVFSPPNFIFAPVWTSLYALMGIAFFKVWSKGLVNPRVKSGLIWFLVQLLFNVGWSIVFFGFHSLTGGLLVIIVLWFLLVVTMIKFYRVDRWAAYLLIPYFLWVSFATFLNFSIWQLN